MSAALLVAVLLAPALLGPTGLTDKGVFSDLDAQVALEWPAWLDRSAPVLRTDAARGTATLFLDGLPTRTYPWPLTAADQKALALPGLRVEASTGGPDTDQDGIPDPVDAAMGARKTALNGDRYDGKYMAIGFPNGDVPRDMGVCTDVVVRGFRNAGLDLQALVIRDMRAFPRRYGLADGEKVNPHVDHRRVRRLIHYFEAYYQGLPPAYDRNLRGEAAWLPGDVVFMDTFPNKPGPDHIGLVSDQVDPLGRPMIINNWTDGWSTRDMPLLEFVPVTHRFRAGLPKRRSTAR